MFPSSNEEEMLHNANLLPSLNQGFSGRTCNELSSPSRVERNLCYHGTKPLAEGRNLVNGETFLGGLTMSS